MMTWDTDMHDPTQKLLIVSLTRTANSCQGLQRHKTASGYFVFPDPTWEGDGATPRYIFFKIQLKKLQDSSIQEFFWWMKSLWAFRAYMLAQKRFISLSTEPNALQFVQWQYQFFCAQSSKLVWGRWGLLGWCCVWCFLLLNNLRPARSSSLLKAAKYF